MFALDLLRRVIRPAIAEIGAGGLAAEQLVLGTAIAESGGFVYLGQIEGPGCGLWSIEPATGKWLLEMDRPASAAVREYLGQRELRPALMGDLHFGAMLCRLRYMRDPRKLPAPGDTVGQARVWKEIYNTAEGKGTPAHYLQLWDAVFPKGFPS